MVWAWVLPVLTSVARTFWPGSRDEMGTALPLASSTLVAAGKLCPPAPSRQGAELAAVRPFSAAVVSSVGSIRQ